MTVPVAGETMAELPAVLDELAGAGYSDIWTSEVNATDAFAPLLMAAQQVPQLRLGTSIAGVFSRSPALMAMSALAVAELSDEPIYVGVGSSSQNMVEQWHGTPFVQPYQRVRDTVRFLRAAFAGDRVTFHGDSFEIDGFRLARVPPRPPRILVAALREGMLRLAGKEGNGVVLNWLSPDDTARVVPRPGREPRRQRRRPALHRDRPGPGGGTGPRPADGDGLSEYRRLRRVSALARPRAGPGGHVGRLAGW